MSIPRTEGISLDLLLENLAFTRTLAADANAVAVSQFGATVARRKADGSLVTRADEQIDRLISARVHERFPAHAVLSEEQATLFDPSIARTWVVDPIDGTTNFALGMSIWGVSIALLQNGMPVVGVASFPLVGEEYAAVMGGGAWRNKEPIHTAPADPPDDAHIFMECTRTRVQLRMELPLKSRMMGSAAYHVCKVAEGSAVAGTEATPKVWDIAAAWLILHEAGGVLHSMDGGDVFPLAEAKRDYGRVAWPIVYAASQERWHQVRSALVRA